MQLAVQNNHPPATAGGTDRNRPRSKKDARAATIAAIHITWKKLRPDLRHDKDELRAERLAFMSRVLKREVTSARDLTQSKLGKVLDAMRDLEIAPLLPGGIGIPACPPRDTAQAGSQDPTDRNVCPTGAEVTHLATAAQNVTIDKLFLHLGWTLEGIERFLLQRFKVRSHRMLTPAKANSLTFILMGIAAQRAIKHRGHEGRVSRRMIGQEIPALKRRLGIDQKPSDMTGDGGPQTDEDDLYEEAE